MSKETQKDNNKEVDTGLEMASVMKSKYLNKILYSILVVVIVIATFYVVKNRDKIVDPIDNNDNGGAVDNIEGDDLEDNLETQGKEITIENIKSGDMLSSPVLIKGIGRSFENNLIVELRNSKHETLVKEFTTIKSADAGEKGEYLITLHFQFRNTGTGFVAVYESSAKDGSELNLVEIPVKFKTIK